MNEDTRTILVRQNRYKADADDTFSSSFIFEKTQAGVLVTEFDPEKGVVDQEYLKNSTPEKEIKRRIGPKVRIVQAKKLQRTALSVGCPACGTKLIRELDFVNPEHIEEVPVVPIFRCTKCDRRFYSLTRAYLERLVDRNPGLFDEKDAKQLRNERETLINTLNEYIIRIFASKKIQRIEVKE